MKTKTLKRLSVSALALVLLATLLFAGAGIGQVTASAAGYIRELDGTVNTNFRNYLDSSVIYQLPDTVGADDMVSVIVCLDRPAILDAYDKTDRSMSIGEYAQSKTAQDIRKTILQDKAKILATLDKKNISYQTGADYDTVLSGFELVIQGRDYEAVARSLGDGAVPILSDAYKMAETQLVENKVNFDEATGIFDSTGFDYDGSGMLIAVLDTGLDYTHSAFSTDEKYFNPSKLAITKDEVAKIMADNDMRAEGLLPGLGVDDVYVNEKVPFSFDYADADSDVYSLHNNHGTHVSGVIVGHDDVIRGVAPNAQLVSMKIFSDVKESAYTSWILAALEDCVTLGVDVINMSLGTACGYSHATEKELVSDVYARIREQGISLVVAASNSFSSAYASEKNGNLPLTSNPDSGTVGSPSTYEGALSVASINGVKTPYLLYNGRIIYFDEATDAATEEKSFFDELLGEGVDSKEFEFVTVPGAGREADYTGMDVTGKIVLVERGFNTFEEKANAAAKKGAAGIIVYNNVSGDIRMNVGTTQLPACSIKQDDGEFLAAAKKGVLKISRSQTSGPFISDFSSWGPTPDLGIKPEITAHGGNILSAITGGDYDRLSGTSMACPNMAGAIALLRQHIMERYPDIANDPVEITSYTIRLLMSTADIMINKNGLPYAVRKQGAGLANLTSASQTPAYILTYNKDGSVMGSSKIELGDDPNKTGVYTLKFSVKNFEASELTYRLSTYVMTEGVSDTKTSHGETTVTEDGYLLTGSVVDFVVSGGGSRVDDAVKVGAGQTADVTVTITLSDADKAYMDASFENGMYVEGYVCLDAISGTDIDLSVPYLAFYGDWLQAPLFDLDYYETNADELDDSIDILDKTLADAYATRPIGGVSQDYVSYLGSYYFVQDPASTKIISAQREYIALSNTEGTIHSLRFVWAGMLRNAQRIEITITDDATGEVVYSVTDYDVRKSYGDGGSIYPANIKIEFDTADYNLTNNSEYTVRLVGYLDYGEDGGLEANEKNVFEFPLVADFEAPALTDCEFYFEYDKELKKNRLYARMAVYDNHYTMAMMLGYVGQEIVDGVASYELVPFDTYLTPVYSVRDGVTYVEYELTDHVQDIKNNSVHKNTFTVACYDYALNEATYEVSLPDEFIDFYFEEDKITLSPNELYTLTPLMYPQTEWGELLMYRSSNPKVATVVNDKIVAIAPGKTQITAYEVNEDGSMGRSVKLEVTVLKEGDEGYRYFDQPVVDVFELTGYDTLKAYYILSTDERELGETGDYRVLDTHSLKFYPSESILLHYKLDAYFPSRTTVLFESSNEKIVKVDQYGIITAQAEGYASVSVRVLLDGKTTYYAESIDIEVMDPFVTSAPALTHYYGLGGLVKIPDTLLLTKIGDFAFSNYNYVPKTEDDIISEDEPDTTKQMFIGDNTITKVIIPEGVKTIGAYAFANLTALTEVVLPSTLEAIEYGAFYGCTSLTKVTGIEHVKLINKDAFYGCNITGTLSLDNARAVGDYAFAGNRNITSIVLPETLQSIGAYTFYGNEKLTSVTVKADKVKYGPYVFAECTSLTQIEMNTGVIPVGAFDGAEKLTKVIIGADVTSIGEMAFHDTAISTFEVAAGNTTYRASSDGSYLLSADGKTLALVAPRLSDTFTLTDAKVTAIAKGAFSSNSRLTSVVMPQVTSVGAYAFAYCSRLTDIQLGRLTELGEYAFFQTSIEQLPDVSGLDKIADYAFAYTALKEVTIPAGMVVGEGAFCECRALSRVVIGDGTTLGYGAFMLGNSHPENYTLRLDPDYTTADQKVYSYEYLSALTSLTIGKNVTVGDAAFMGASKLTSVTLGEGARLGKQAFYNAASLAEIDLSGVIAIGENAFSGDDLFVHGDSNGNSYVYDENGQMLRRTYAAMLTEVDLSSLQTLGPKAFMYCKQLLSVHLGDQVTAIGEQTFYACDSLARINLGKIKTVGAYAFDGTVLTEADLSSATQIGEYSFVRVETLAQVTFNAEGAEIGEGAFAYCAALVAPENLNKVQKIGAYAFAYAGIVSADLSGATHIDDMAFLKEEITDFEVILGQELCYLGDNPFALCRLAPFWSTTTVEFNGKQYEVIVYTYDISESVHVIDGSLYCDVPTGMELIAYAGTESRDVVIPEGTVRVTAYAFAGADVVRVELPATLASIGHKAFYGCYDLSIVAFGSYEAPNLEEEYDPSYYECMENLPATGRYEFTPINEDRIEVKYGLEIVPYYMWNISDGKYSNVYYGANFVDYIGHNREMHLTMVRPSNGLYYDTFIYGQYFATVYDGDVAADAVTQAAIDAINKIIAITDSGETIKLKHKDLVEAARAAYDKVATKAQQALVTNLAALLSAEDRIAALSDEETAQPPADAEPAQRDLGRTLLVVAVIVESALILGAATAAVVWYLLRRRKAEGQSEAAASCEQGEDALAQAEEPASEERSDENAQESAQDKTDDQ